MLHGKRPCNPDRTEGLVLKAGVLEHPYSGVGTAGTIRFPTNPRAFPRACGSEVPAQYLNLYLNFPEMFVSDPLTQL